MGLSQHCAEFGGRPVQNFDPRLGIAGPTDITYRVASTDYDSDDIAEHLATFLADRNAPRVQSLVIGCWSYDGDDSSAVVQALVAARERLTGLRALFLGDIVYEEQEISWINQSDVSPLLAAYPDLEEFRVRGANGLRFGVVSHAKLRRLSIESGGLPGAVVREVCASRLPALEHLEFWLGSGDYGGDATLADLEPVLSGRAFPKLKSLGLRDSPSADELAQAVVASPLVRQLEVLDFADGTLGDVGARALLGLPLGTLKRLDVRHHYISDEVLAQVEALPLEVQAGPRQTDHGEDERYVAHAE